jgi:hypothetical protein
MTFIEQEFARHIKARPDEFTEVPGHPGVYVHYFGWRSEPALVYGGWATDLIALGLMDEAWLQPTGEHLRDSDGDPVTVTQQWREKDGTLTRYCHVVRSKPAERAMRLPSAAEAIAAYQAYVTWDARRRELARAWGRERLEPPIRSERLIVH